MINIPISVRRPFRGKVVFSLIVIILSQAMYGQAPLQKATVSEPGSHSIVSFTRVSPEDLPGTKNGAKTADPLSFTLSLSATHPQTEIELSWTKNAQGDEVIIVWNVESVIGTPEDSIRYSSGDPIPGGGLVLYAGGLSSVTHNNLSPGTRYYYKIFSRDEDMVYSTGISDNIQTNGSPIDKPTNLTTEVTGCGEVTLTWDVPVSLPWSFTEDFESYTDFTISDMGQWTLIDGDEEPTYPTSSFDYTNEGDTMAYIIFNPNEVTNIASPPLSSAWDAHGGNKYAASIAVIPCGSPNTCPNDDWLISPQLSLPGNTELRFWAKSVTDYYGLERFTVNVSTTGTSPGDFTKISAGTYLEAPTSWTEYVYDLSSYAGQDVYIGIHCISDDAWFFMVDDFSVTETSKGKQPPKSLSGYRIYQNGYLLDSVDASTTTYLDTMAGYTENHYYVVAVYSQDSVSAPEAFAEADPAASAGTQIVFEEDFEGSVASWMNYSYYGPWDSWFVQDDISHTGDWAAAFERINRWNWDVLISPPIVLNGVSEVTLKYWEYVNRTNQPALQEVRVLLDYPGTGPPYNYTDTLITDTLGQEGVWVEKTFKLTNMPDTIYLAFDYFGWNDSDWYIDDISVEVNNECYLFWTGDTDKDWNVPSNWSTGQVPGAGDDVLIPAGRPNYPELNTATLAETKLLQIDRSATVDLQSTEQMTVHGPLLVNGRLTLHSDNNGTASLIDNGSVRGTGRIFAEQYLSADRWHYIAARAYPEYTYKYLWLFLLDYEETNGDWGSYIVPTDILIEPGNGYAIWSNSSATGDTTVTYTANVITGEFTIEGLSRTAAVVDSLEGFNLVGNPYNSALDWDDPSLSLTNVGDAIYFWDPDANGGLGGYASYIDGVGTPATTNGIIPPGQGFFVRVSQGHTSGSLQFDNRARVHDTLDFYKNAEKKAVTDLLRLTISSNGASDETVIRFLEDATNGFDQHYDASKLFANVPSIPQIFTECDSTCNDYLAINSLPELTSPVSVSMGVRTPSADTYLINASELATFAEAVDIIVEDVRTGAMHDLQSSNEFVFASQGGQESGRFLVHFYPSYLKGTLHYDNVATDPLAGFPVEVRNTANELVFTDSTDAYGGFVMHNLRNDIYSMSADISLPWDGVNATDALIIARHFTGLDTLTGAAYSAADVDYGGYVNSNDAMQVQRRYVGQISSFPAGDWYVDTTKLILTGEDSVQFMLPALCYGDVNASYNPLKRDSKVEFANGTFFLNSVAEALNLPVRTLVPGPAAAVSLHITYPEAFFRIEDVTLPSGKNVLWNVKDGVLSVATADLEPLHLARGDVLLNISMSPLTAQVPESFDLGILPGSEIADAEAKIYENYLLTIESQKKDKPELHTWPNPLSHGKLNLRVNGLDEEKARIVLLDITGRTLWEREISGTTSDRALSIDIEGLSPGLYHLVLTAGSAGNVIRLAEKVLVR